MTKDLNDEEFQTHLKFMVYFAEICGANATRAKEEMSKVLEFEQLLVKVPLNPQNGNPQL